MKRQLMLHRSRVLGACLFLMLIVRQSGIASSPVISALVDTVLMLPENEQRDALWKRGYPVFSTDTMVMIQFFKKIETELIRRGEKKLAREAWSMLVEYNTIYRHLYADLGITYIDQYIAEARSKGWDAQEAQCIIRKGMVYYYQYKFGPAFEFLQKGYEKIKALGLHNFPGFVGHLQSIGQCYYEFGDYELAIYHLREAIQVKSLSKEKVHTYIAKNTLGMAFQKVHQYDSAIYYFQSAHKEALEYQHSFWAALANGNLGNVYFQQGRYDEAIPLMITDHEESIKANEFSSAVHAAMGLATMYLKRNQTKEATYYLDFALKNINYGSIRDLSGFYRNLSEISRIRGDYERAFAYIDSSHFYADSLRRFNDARILDQTRLKVEVERHANEIKLLETIRSRQVLIRNGMLAILLLTGVIAMLWVNRQRLKQKKEQEVALLQQERMEDELKNAKRQLSTFTNTLKEKNDLIESFRSEIELLHASGASQVHERTEQLSQLLNSTILTEEDWKEFRQLFDKVHPGFFIRLKEKMSDLSPADTRLLALTKLQLAPKEMAAMLGLTYEAIKKSRQRLRKKINLPEEGSLDELVDMI